MRITLCRSIAIQRNGTGAQIRFGCAIYIRVLYLKLLCFHSTTEIAISNLILYDNENIYSASYIGSEEYV